MYNTIMSFSQIARKKRSSRISLDEMCDEIVAGVDEAGRGPWAGPVVAAAVVPETLEFEYADSKILSPLRREVFFQRISETCRIGLGIASPEEIDLLNILNATKLAVKRAVDDLDISPDRVLIDGKYLEFDRRCRCVISGDQLDPRIAAASIIAKVMRDAYMISLSRVFPEFSFFAHKGYGTTLHRRELTLYGATPWHRLTYFPVRTGLSGAMMEQWLMKGMLSIGRLYSVMKKLGGDGYHGPGEGVLWPSGDNENAQK